MYIGGWGRDQPGNCFGLFVVRWGRASLDYPAVVVGVSVRLWSRPFGTARRSPSQSQWIQFGR